MTNHIKIKLTGLRVFAHHGVMEFERAYGQWFVIDATVWVENGEILFADDLDKSVHYGVLADKLVEDAKANPVELLETLANRLLKLVLEFNSSVVKAKITVHKPDAPIDHEFADVSVTVKAKK